MEASSREDRCHRHGDRCPKRINTPQRFTAQSITTSCMYCTLLIIFKTVVAEMVKHAHYKITDSVPIKNVSTSQTRHLHETRVVKNCACYLHSPLLSSRHSLLL